MRLVKLSEICEFQKGETGLAKAEAGDYPLVTTGSERKTCKSYQFDAKAVCIPLVSSTGHGHASLNNVHYQEGKFALGSILVALTAKNEKELNIQFLHLYLSQLKDQVLVPLMSGAANVALSVKKIEGVEIPLPSIERQTEIVNKFKSIALEESQLKAELLNQQYLLKRIREKILEEAIVGSLTSEWRTTNSNVKPAKNLITLSAKKKLDSVRKKKTLLPVSDKEKYFELPEKWEWYRLGDLFEIVRGSSPRPKGDPLYWDNKRTKYHWITIADFTPFGADGVLLDTKGFLTKEGASKSRAIRKGDLLVACSGVGSVGRSIESGIDGYIYDGLLAVRNIDDECLKNMTKLFLKYKESQIYSVASGANWLNINIEILSNYVFALPPPEEQKVIFEKVERLFKLCDQLEDKITKSQSNMDVFIQAVLREEFSYKSKLLENGVFGKKGNHLAVSKKNSQYYKRTLLAAEIVDQLQQEPTLGHLKLQKLVFLCQKTQGMDLPTNFLQQAAGPYDPKMARSLDKQLREKSWFEYKKSELHKYRPLDKAGEHKADYQKYFSKELEGVSYVINLFRKTVSDDMEAVATLYACWDELIQSSERFGNDEIIEKFYAWSEQKSKFNKSYLEKTISWMIDKKICPVATLH